MAGARRAAVLRGVFFAIIGIIQHYRQCAGGNTGKFTASGVSVGECKLFTTLGRTASGPASVRGYVGLMGLASAGS